MDRSLRYLNPLLTDKVSKLLELCENKPSTKPLLWKGMSTEKYSSTLEKYEKEIAGNLGFNFILSNIPSHAIQAHDNKKVKVTYTAMKDTFNQFGDVYKIEMYKGTAYIKFKTKLQAKETHGLVNNMQIGENIVKTKVI